MSPTATPRKNTAAPPKYPKHSSLREKLNQRVEAYFSSSGVDRHGGPRLWGKTLILIGWTVLSFVALVFFAETWWEVLGAATSLGLAVAGIGFNIQHDGNHGSYASKSWGNRLASFTLDLIGGSSYMWRFKHNLFHHHYTNVDGVDDDLQAEPFLRLSPGQRRRWYHRFQHYYIWPLYAFIPAKWHWFDDFKQLVTGRINRQTFPRPRGWALAGLLAGKIAFVAWALALPFFLHPPGIVLAVYAFVCLVTGVTLGTVFQLAHCVEEAAFEPCPADGQRLPLPWAEHQLATTVNFSPRSRLLTWYLGGLNFQVEHHLYPKISHVHYPAIADVVRQACEDLGVQHRSHPSVWGALASHVRHMRRLGASGHRA